jgi:hypothetical protein
VQKVEPLNSQRRERRKVLVFSLAGGRARRAMTKGELYTFRDLRYCDIIEEDSRVMTHERVKSQTAKKNLWINLKGDSSRESERANMTQGHIEQSCEWTSAKG